jgi:hypothetical protein
MLFIYADGKRCGGLLIVLHLFAQLGQVMACQLIGDIVES